MEARDEDLVKSLAETNPELKRAYEEHARLKAQVDELTSRSHLSPLEEVDRKNLQKKKLAEKTKISKILEEFRKGDRQRRSA